MKAALASVLGILLAGAAGAMPGHDVDGPLVEVDFTNQGLTPAHWTMILHPDGSGHFRSERGHLAPENAQALDVPEVDRDIRVSAEFAGNVFAAAGRHKWFNAECESHMKVAFQGWKKLSYAGPEGQGSCSFNYSKDKEIQALGDSLVGLAGTILEGSRLEMLLRHDRLGLDHELEYLAEAAGDGRLKQVCAIRGILERLSEDPDVMERVRKRARVLLAKAEE